MSRLIVKGLPKELTEERMKAHFGKFAVTDVKIMRTDKGASRRFGFIGLKSKEEAEKALKYFNNSYIKTCRISVEFAKTQAEIGNKSSKQDKIKALMSRMKENTSAAKFDKVSSNQPLSNDSEIDPHRLFVKNLPHSTTEEEIHAYFSQFGEVEDVTFLEDAVTRQCMGSSFVRFVTQESALLCLTKADEAVFQGRILHLIPAKPAMRKGEPVKKELSEMEQKKEEKKQATGSDSWNFLFLNQDAVVEATAKKYKLTKAEVLDRDNSEVALQIASMETELIKETKEWLESEGIYLDNLKGDPRDAKRSKTVLIVKNISASVDKNELLTLFERYGKVVRLSLSPSNTQAIVELATSEHRKNCMKNLSEYKLKGVPMYLEPAPEGLVQESTKTEVETEFDSGDTLFISNLNFSTTQEALESMFTEKGYTATVDIARKGEYSRGFGFAKFESEEEANKAIRDCQGSIVDDHCLQMKIAKSSSSKPLLGSKRKRVLEINEAEYEGKNAERTKILVKNLAFEVTKEEIKKLFKQKGEIKSVVLPKKMDGGIRGFGFVSFVSREEAVKAFKELQNTHFYGRKLVLEWAKKEDSIEDRREFTKRKMNMMMAENDNNQMKGKFKG